MQDTLQQFQDYLYKLQQYTHALTQLYWDLPTQTPKKGKPAKIEAISFFSTELFRLETAPEFGALLETLSAPDAYQQLEPAMQLTVTRYLRDYKRSKKIPHDFHTAFVKEKAESGVAWEDAKRNDDYDLFEPHLQKLIDMTKEWVQYQDPEADTYEFLLSLYEEGMDSATIDRLFDDVKKALTPLVEEIQKKDRTDPGLFRGHYPIEDQKKLQDLLLSYMGFDPEAGATAESEHPFTNGFGPTDVRVTNHFNEEDFINAAFSAIHEGGHAIFEQNIDPELAKTAAGQVNLLGLHESQSRFFENILGRNIHFWEPIYEKVCALLPGINGRSLEDFEKAINHVQSSLIRTEADEVTYAFHIILRYELEKAIFREGVTARELPQLWNDKMEELLGIRPETDREGILQDTHWSDGSFGYFPTYLLGTIYDGMFLEALERDLGNVDTLLAEGRIREITHWLNTKIHQYGSLYLSKEVIKRVCGKEISADPIIKYFKEKYLKR